MRHAEFVDCIQFPFFSLSAFTFYWFFPLNGLFGISFWELDWEIRSLCISFCFPGVGLFQTGRAWSFLVVHGILFLSDLGFYSLDRVILFSFVIIHTDFDFWTFISSRWTFRLFPISFRVRCLSTMPSLLLMILNPFLFLFVSLDTHGARCFQSCLCCT